MLFVLFAAFVLYMIGAAPISPSLKQIFRGIPDMADGEAPTQTSGGKMDLMNELKGCLNKALIHNDVTRGRFACGADSSQKPLCLDFSQSGLHSPSFHECARALDLHLAPR